MFSCTLYPQTCIKSINRTIHLSYCYLPCGVIIRDIINTTYINSVCCPIRIFNGIFFFISRDFKTIHISYMVCYCSAIREAYNKLMVIIIGSVILHILNSSITSTWYWIIIYRTISIGYYKVVRTVNNY